MYKIILIAATASFLLFLNCSTDEPYKPITENDQKGTIVFKVNWPSKGYVAKIADVEEVSSITAYVNSSTGIEITHADLIHEGNRGKAEISVAAGNNYQVVLVAFENSLIKYIGSDDDVDVVAGGTTTAEVTMANAAPVLNSAQSTGANAYSFSWSSSPFATNYKFQQDDNDSFSSPVDFSGSFLTKSFTDVAAGKYYHRVCGISKYGTTIWSETKTVEVGSNGTIIIDIPWPDTPSVILSLLTPLTKEGRYVYLGGLIGWTISGELLNSGKTDATSVSITLIACDDSGIYLENGKGTGDIGTVPANSYKAFSVSFGTNIFGGTHPAKTFEYVLTYSEGEPITGIVNVP